MRVVHSTEEIRNITEQAVEYFITCARCGQPVDLNSKDTFKLLIFCYVPLEYNVFLL